MIKSTITFTVKLKWWWPILFPVWVTQRLIHGKNKVDAYLPRCVMKIERCE